ncbi:hypothetical protein OG757_33645 [Streptomyces sp. NBC_01262]
MGRLENPVDPEAGPAARLAHELRELRKEAGGPTYREMAGQVPHSVATLARAAAGVQLPTLQALLGYVEACGGNAAEWEQRWRQASEEAAGEEGIHPPYRGLFRFETTDRGWFFGRDRLVAELLDLVERERFSALLGASGSGKSSLLRAGLIPRLREARAPRLRPAAIRVLTPGEHPMRTHAGLLKPDRAGGAADTLVIVDQFEGVHPLRGPGRADRLHRAAAGRARAGQRDAGGPRTACGLLRPLRRAPPTGRGAARGPSPGRAHECAGGPGGDHRAGGGSRAHCGTGADRRAGQ